MAPIRISEGRDETTPIETPIPSPIRRCPLHDEVVDGLRDDLVGLRTDVKDLRAEVAEVKGHVLVLTSSIGKIDKCLDTIDARAFQASKVASGAANRLTSILMALGAVGAVLVGGLIAGITIARAMAGG